MTLAEELKHAQTRTAPCKLGRHIASAPPADAQALTDALNDRECPSSRIMRVYRKHVGPISHATIWRHRHRECGCYPTIEETE